MQSADTIMFAGSILAQDQQSSAASKCRGQQVAASLLEGHHMTYLGHIRRWWSSTVASGLILLHVTLAPVSFLQYLVVFHCVCVCVCVCVIY